MNQDAWTKHLKEARDTLDQFSANASNIDQCVKLGHQISKTIQQQGTLFVCGNGGSHCEALHFAEEWTGRFDQNRKPIAALALGEATHTTCVGNDFGFEHVFSRQLEALSRPGDFILFLSTSGNSPNLLRAAEVAQQKGLTSAALLGRDGGALKSKVALPIIVPAKASHRIQEVHLQIIHSVIDLVERELFPT